MHTQSLSRAALRSSHPQSDNTMRRKVAPGDTSVTCRSNLTHGRGPFPLESVRDLSESCKGVLLDQFGCLHDGKAPYPEAIDAVRAMAERGIRILILSNSSRRSQDALEKLGKLGFDPSWFEGAVTSGEVTHQHLNGRSASSDPFWQGLGSRALHMTWGQRGAIVLDTSLAVDVTQMPSEANFILSHGTEALGASKGHDAVPFSVPELEVILRECSALMPPPPMIVANPDFVTVSGDALVTMPGHLGREYAKMGGKVVLMGKPAPVIYDVALEKLGLPAHEVVAIGDSLEHDIAGAASAGIRSLFITGGIHRSQLKVSDDYSDSAADTLDDLCRRYDCPAPTYVMSLLR